MNGVNFVDRGRRLQSNHESLPREPIQRKADHPKCVAVEERSYSFQKRRSRKNHDSIGSDPWDTFNVFENLSNFKRSAPGYINETIHSA